MDSTYFSGRLLVATPHTGGDVFRRSVVLLLHHDEDGAQGIVLNRPLDADVRSVLPTWQAHVTPPGRLFQGGPVGLDSALGLVTVPGDASSKGEPLGVRLLFGGLGLVDLDAPPPVVTPEIAGLRIFAGYAGWSGGQLEAEIEAGGWYVVDAEARDGFTADPPALWAQVLRRQRSNPCLRRLLSRRPGPELIVAGETGPGGRDAYTRRHERAQNCTQRPERAAAAAVRPRRDLHLDRPARAGAG